MGLKDLFNFKAASQTVKDGQKDVRRKPAKVSKLDDQRAKKQGKK